MKYALKLLAGNLLCFALLAGLLVVLRADVFLNAGDPFRLSVYTGKGFERGNIWVSHSAVAGWTWGRSRLVSKPCVPPLADEHPCYGRLEPDLTCKAGLVWKYEPDLILELPK